MSDFSVNDPDNYPESRYAGPDEVSLDPDMLAVLREILAPLLGGEVETTAAQMRVTELLAGDTAPDVALANYFASRDAVDEGDEEFIGELALLVAAQSMLMQGGDELAVLQMLFGGEAKATASRGADGKIDIDVVLQG